MTISCSVDKYIPEGEHMLTGVAVTCDNEEVMKTYMLADYNTLQTNSKWFGAKVPLKIYMLSGTDNQAFMPVLEEIGRGSRALRQREGQSDDG